MNLYTDTILDHYYHPRHYGELKKYSVRASEENPLCGDSLTLDLAIDRRGMITAVAFRGGGCAISQAGMSLLADYALGKSLFALKRFNIRKNLALLEVPISPGRMKCATLGLATLHKALKSYSSTTYHDHAKTTRATKRKSLGTA